jgi:hypothetical protein
MADLDIVYECPRCGKKTIAMGCGINKVCFCYGSETNMVPKPSAMADRSDSASDSEPAYKS